MDIAETINLHAEEQHAEERLDRFLADNLEGQSRSRIKALIKQGHIYKNNEKIIEPNYRVRAGDEFSVNIPEPEDAAPKSQDIPLNIIYEDSHIIVIDKPAGLVVHPAAGNWTGTLVNALLAHCGDSLSGIGGVKRPGIVHRLDKDTSGLMVVAKTDQAHKDLSKQFAAHGRDGRMVRAYTALVWGQLPKPKGSIDAPLGRKQNNRLKIAIDPDGKPAITHYNVQKVYVSDDNIPVVSKIECILETGRTHQIRVHMAHIGHPLLGDQTYGSGFAASISKLNPRAQSCLGNIKRQVLHAYKLGFNHPITGEPQVYESNLPGKLRKLCEALDR